MQNEKTKLKKTVSAAKTATNQSIYTQTNKSMASSHFLLEHNGLVLPCSITCDYIILSTQSNRCRSACIRVHAETYHHFDKLIFPATLSVVCTIADPVLYYSAIRTLCRVTRYAYKVHMYIDTHNVVQYPLQAIADSVLLHILNNEKLTKLIIIIDKKRSSNV